MTSVGDRQSRPAHPGRVTRQALLRALAVLALIAGVVAMHALSAGHQPMAMTGTGHVAASTHPMTHESQPPPHGDTTASACLACATAMPIASDGGHDMGTMCLAVLPLLLLLLLRPLHCRADALATSTLSTRLSSRVLTARGPPGSHLCPSLSKLCILRT